MNGNSLAWSLACIAASALLGVSACTALLGNDFTVESGHGGGGGGAGAGGAGGQAGAANPYVCGWQAAEHLELGSTETTSDTYQELFAVSRGGDDALVVASRNTPDGMVIEVHPVQGNDPQQDWSFSADRLLDVRRLDAASIGILNEQVDFNVIPVVRWVSLEIVPDADFDGTTVASRNVVSETDLVDLDQMGGFQGHFTSTPGQGPQHADIVIAYRTTASQLVEKYGHYAGGDVPATMVRINKPAVVLDDNDIRDGELIYVDGQSHYIVGESGAHGLRGFVLDASVTGPIDARTIGDESWLSVAFEPQSDGVNVALASFGVTAAASLHGARLPFSAFGTFVGSDVPDMLQLDSIADIPVNQTDIRWAGDILAFVGTTQADKLTLRFQFFDLLGRDRGSDPLPFTALATGREQVSRVRITGAGSKFDVIGDSFGVAWIDAQNKGAGSFDVLYYDRLNCYR